MAVDEFSSQCDYITTYFCILRFYYSTNFLAPWRKMDWIFGEYNQTRFDCTCLTSKTLNIVFNLIFSIGYYHLWFIGLDKTTGYCYCYIIINYYKCTVNNHKNAFLRINNDCISMYMYIMKIYDNIYLLFLLFLENISQVKFWALKF